MVRRYFKDTKGKARTLRTSADHPEKNQDCITSMIDDKDRGHGHLTIDNLTLWDAYKNLTKEEFAVYLYLAGNADNYTQGFSPSHIHNVFGMDVKTARKAKEGLKAKGYLVNTGKFENDFVFHRVPVEIAASPEQVTLDRLTAEVAILTTDKHVKRQMKYARTENDFDAIDETVKLRLASEYPQLAEDAPAEQKPVFSEKDIDWFGEFSKLKEESPDLPGQLEKATGEEYTRITGEMRQTILKKYGLA